MTDISDASRFFIKFVNDNQYEKIEGRMNKFDYLQADDLERPIKKNTVCAARFKLDENWYRAKVLRGVGKNQYEVEFIDFGNSDTVNGDDLKRLPADLLAIEPSAKECSLAYIQVPRIDSEFGEEAAKYI
jgi:staphylococcal nuclease domain-containing protein 1